MRWIIAILVCCAASAQSFEVASVKRVPDNERTYTNISPYGTGTFRAKSVTMMLLIAIAFDIDEKHVIAPNWISSECYDVIAKGSEGVPLNYEQVKPRLRRLLEEGSRSRRTRAARREI